ncbi:YSC84-related protein [Glaciimonas sp. CA11.2]|uniref:BPSL1445 family SYLF domain-containing lipoprotein n=1 Tax=Glaciimonas sp. CA11.2 TaxID=3048601 RepID=UPI002AB4FEC7|nr:YSC84-related protein [Glaciimonas sp. CA11.2]MDY7547684.1 YSC84-related protein [Glaciimonas sp. CA11.2]MEB0161399.1 YSC84-related protein [Glaciimonas sp. CA11.2]
MYRRDFILKTAGVLGMTSLVLAGCTTTSPSDANADPGKRRRQIDTSIDTTMARLYTAAPHARELVSKANGVLVFPSVIAAGFGIGGQYGEGALRVGNKTDGYYSTASASIGLQIGAQSKALIFLFMTQDSLNKFRSSNGWAVGADASVAVLKIGANGEIDTTSMTSSVLAFVLTNSGLMANLTLEGTKVSRLNM